MPFIRPIQAAYLFFFLGGFACSQSTSTSDLPATSYFEKDNKFFIIDETGKVWEIIHALKKYGMAPQGFQFGLGPFAIRPVLDPQLPSPGDENYPHENEEFLVLGTKIDDEARAYSIDKLSDTEIIDEEFGDAHVAVAYRPLAEVS